MIEATEVKKETGTFETLTAEWGQQIINRLDSFGNCGETIWDLAQKEWRRPDDMRSRMIKKANAMYKMYKISDPATSISLVARRNPIDRAVKVLTGLAHVDVRVLMGDTAYVLETGWDFKKQEIVIEGVLKSEADRRDQFLSVNEASDFFKRWLQKTP